MLFSNKSKTRRFTLLVGEIKKHRIQNNMANKIKIKSAFLSATDESAIEQMKKQIAALEQKSVDNAAKNAAKIDAKLGENGAGLAKFLGVEDGLTAYRCISTFAKHGTVNPAAQSVERASLSVERKAEIIAALKENHAIEKGKGRLTGEELAKKFGVSTPTIQNLKTEAGVARKLV